MSNVQLIEIRVMPLELDTFFMPNPPNFSMESQRGFEFFQKFMKENGIIDELLELGMQEGDTVKLYGWQFEYYE